MKDNKILFKEEVCETFSQRMHRKNKKEFRTWAIQEAVRRNVMRDYLERKGGETLSILTAEYSFDVAVAVKQEEAYSIGREEGISIGLERGIERGVHQKALETAKKLLARGDSPAEIADLLSLSVSQVQELKTLE